jgi:hypothetical protein
MLKNIGLFSFSFFLISSVSHAMLLVDVPEDQESQKKVIRCLKKNTFPNISVNDQETIADLTNHFSTFSNGTLLQTPESTFFAKKLNQEGINRPVIHIPNTIYDLEVIYHFLTDKVFHEIATQNSQWGLKNNVGIKDSSVIDKQFLSLSKNIFQIFNTFTTEDDFIKHTINRVESINLLKNSTNNSLLASTQGLLSKSDSLDLIIATISHELQSQKEGKINFYRTSGGLAYNENLGTDEITLSQHPKGTVRLQNDIHLLRGFFTDTGPNTMQTICDRQYPPLSKDSTLDEILAFEKNYENPNFVWGPMIREIAQNVLEKGKIVDYPFNHEPGKMNPQNLQFKELSYSYSLLGGFIFDGVQAMQSACPFVYAERSGNQEKYPFFYALSYKLPDFYNKYAPCFKAPQTPLYQSVLDAGEDFHPRFELKSKGAVQSELSNFYGNIKILGLFGEDANTRKNKLFTQGLETRHTKLIANTKDLKNDIFLPVSFQLMTTDRQASGTDVGRGNGISDYSIFPVQTTYMPQQMISEMLENILSLNPDEEIRIRSDCFFAKVGEKVRVSYDIELFDSGLALNLLSTNKKTYIGNSYALDSGQNQGTFEMIIPEESLVSFVFANKRLDKGKSCWFTINSLKIEKTDNK